MSFDKVASPKDCLFLTANSGSVFETQSIFDKYIFEIQSLVTVKKPCFVAIHFQEVGGKEAAKNAGFLDKFFKSFMMTMYSLGFNRQFLVADQDTSDKEKFISMGCAYFVHMVVRTPLLYNYKNNTYTLLSKIVVHCGNITGCPHLHYEKFSLELLQNKPESRKGFLKTRWKLDNRSFECINTHMIAETDNTLGLKTKFPQSTAALRRAAMEYIISTTSPTVPYLIFGDFNHRLSYSTLVQDKGLTIKEENDTCEVVNSEGKLCFKIKKSEYMIGEAFKNVPFSDYLKYNIEIDYFKEDLEEQKITFDPTYQYEDEPDSKGTNFSKKRPFAWTDRVFLSKKNRLFSKIKEYDSLGKMSNVGDHKLVYLLGTIDFYPNMIKAVINGHVLRKPALDKEQLPIQWNVFNFAKFTETSNLSEEVKSKLDGPDNRQK